MVSLIKILKIETNTVAFYHIRNYNLFSLLANSRYGKYTPISKPREIPSDVSEEVGNEHSHWGGHTNNSFYLFLQEILDYKPNAGEIDLGFDFFNFVETRAKEMGIEDFNNARIVFWFDN